MTIRLLALCVFICQSATTLAYQPQQKNVTLSLAGISMEEALAILGIRYGVQFSYSDDVVPLQTIISLTIHDEPLDSALVKLMRPYRITYKKVRDHRIVLQKAAVPLTQIIRGTVKDQVTSAPIRGATVILKDVTPLTGTTTDDQGRFKIDPSPVGRISLVISSIGYNTTVISGVLLATGKELVLNVQLSESIVPMTEVVITALRNDGIPGDGVALTSSRSFSMEDTKRYAGSLGDPARMASAFAGVTIGSDDTNALVVRGNSPRGVLWRVDGIEVPNPNHFATEGASHGVVSIVSPNVIGNSDFLTGAFPAQYGNALSAVFDIHLRNGNNERKEHAIQAGLLGLEVSTEGPTSRTHKSSYLANYRYSTLSVLDKFGIDLNKAGEYKDYQDLSFKLHCPTRAGTFSFFGIGGKSKSNLSDTTLFDNNASDIGITGLTYSHLVNSNTLLNGSLSYAGSRITKISEANGIGDNVLALTEDYSKSYTRFSLSARRKVTHGFFAEGGLTLSRVDYNFFLKDVDPGNPNYQVIINFQEQGHTTIAQGFLYARQYFSPRLFGFYGLHFMHFAFTHDRSLEPRLGLKWEITDEKSLSVAYGKHSRIENLQYYLARDHQPGGSEIQFNKHLGFTRSNHAVVSYTQRLPASNQFKAEIYHQQLFNAPVQSDPASYYASINEDTGFITDSLTNEGRGKNYGVEISLEKSFSDNMYYLINGSVFQSTFSLHDYPDRNTAYNGNYSLHLLVGKEFVSNNQRGRFGINLKVTQAGGRRYVPIDLERSTVEKKQVYDWERAFNKQLPDYFRSDFQLSYRLNRHRCSMEWRLDVQNITNRRNPAYYYFDAGTESIRLKRQIGILPLISYRLEF